ncbi:acyltransferase family protein [Albidovulum sp.]|uniref:acyltransferase family protein n=1 Tax=Albidovulum sp. TaxID=1872424 RepID=UPI0039B8609E
MSVRSDFISKRSVPLDCIRATAIVMVVVFHVATRYPDAVLDPVAALFRKYGTLGVDIFFPLSGYLITSFLIRHVNAGSIRTFFLRRFFRIVPLYMVAVTIYFVAMRVLGQEPAIIDRIWIPYTFLTGWFIFFDGVDSVPYTITWSLSVEEFSYILIGLAALLARRSLLAFLIGISLLSLGLRFYFNLIGHEGIYHFPLTRLDSIGMGGILAWCMGRGINMFWPLVLATLGSIAARSLGGAFAPTFLYTLVTCLALLAITVSETWLAGYRGLLATAYARVGFYSYFIYLFHFMVLEAQLMVERRLGLESLPFWLNAALCLALSVAAAVVSFRYFEGPMLQFGRRLERRATPVAGPAVTGASHD